LQANGGLLYCGVCVGWEHQIDRFLLVVLLGGVDGNTFETFKPLPPLPESVINILFSKNKF
jgi:hypothetical protein